MTHEHKTGRGRVVVWGLLTSYPFGGMSWQVLHHLVGLRRLGFDVWYVEESSRRPLDPVTFVPTDEWKPNLEFLAREMDRFGLGERWFYCPPGGGEEECYGAGDWSDLRRLYREADVVFNLCGAQELREHHEDIGCLVLLQTDPVEPHVAIAKGEREALEYYGRYDHLITYGENLGSSRCPVPVETFQWHLTRPPVCMDMWFSEKVESSREGKLTTIAAWRSRGKDVEWEGETWTWSKHVQFEEYIELPSRSSIPLEIAISGSRRKDRERLRVHGWNLRPATEVADPLVYRDYIWSSLGEFTVSKEQYVASRSGWFSDRSVCYLASGRPVITQDTGLASVMPNGEGLLFFSEPDEALEAIESVAGNYGRHSAAAKAIARSYFNADVVLERLVSAIGL